MRITSNLLCRYKTEVKRLVFVFVCLLPIVFVLLFIGYLPVTFSISMNVSIEHTSGKLTSYNRSNTSLNIYYGTIWELGNDTENITLETNNNGYDLDSLLFSNNGGIKKIVFHSFVTSIWGFRTVNTSGVDLGQHTYLKRGIIPSLDNDVFSLTFENPDTESFFMINGYDFIPYWFWIIYGAIVLIINLIITLIVYYIVRKLKKWKGMLLSLSASVSILFLGMAVNHTLSYITYDYFFLNWVIVFIVCNIVNCLMKRYLGTILGMLSVLLWYCANYYAILYRSKPIMPSDLYAVKTAGEVIGGYNIIPTLLMVMSLLIWLVYSFLLIRVSKLENIKKPILFRGFEIIVSIGILVLCLNNPIYNSLNTFEWNLQLLDDFYSEGMVLSFTRSFFSSFVREPKGYSREIVNGYLERYLSQIDEDTKTTKPEKIIMIMNEAFSDLRSAGMTSEVDVMPFIDSLKNDTLKGTVFVSVYGGGTCNTEFEALTGNTLAFLPSGSYPYSQHIKNEMFSLASYLKNCGYETTAFHPGARDSWNRENVYPFLGFESFYSRDEYEGIEYLHLLPDDASNYRFIESIVENSRKPSFSFNVTYQNHSGYDTWEDVPKNESALLIPSEDGQIYLSLVAASDKAVEELIHYYEKSDEKVMIVFFGDHQPGLQKENDYYIFNNNVGGLNKFQTGFFIWTNYESVPETGTMISSNYLPLIVLERGGFRLPPYIKMLKEVHEQYPVITSQGILDKDGQFYVGISELEDDPLIQMYQYVQYANMFDKLDKRWFEST